MEEEEDPIPVSCIHEHLFSALKDAEGFDAGSASKFRGVTFLGCYMGVAPSSRATKPELGPIWSCRVYEFENVDQGGARIIWELAETKFQIEDFAALDAVNVLFSHLHFTFLFYLMYVPFIRWFLFSCW